MAYAPQAPRYTDEDLRQLVRRIRTDVSPAFSSQFENKTDYEVLTHLRNNFRGYETIPHSLPSDITDAHWKARDPNYGEIFYKDPQIDVEEQLAVAKDRTIAGSIMGLGGIVDMFPDWLGDAVKSGANESITGLAIHIATGDAPFKSPWNEKNEPDMFQTALGFGAGMIYDGWFFLGTEGLGLPVALAGKAARNEAAEYVAKAMFRTGAKNNAGKLGIKELPAKELVEAVEKAVASSGDNIARETAEDAMNKGMRELVNLGADKATVQALKETSEEMAESYVAKAINNPSFLKDDILEVAGYTLKEPIKSPELRTITNYFGMKSAKALGLYNVALDVEHQAVEAISQRIDPETNEPYEYGKAKNLLDRWKEGEPGLTGADWAWDAERTMWTGMHGIAGGYFAGALGGVMRAGQAGPFAEGNFQKYLSESHPIIENHIYGHLVGVPVEAAGFTGVGYLLEAMGDKSQLGVPLGERLLHNLVTIGTLKGMHETFDVMRQHKGRLEDKFHRSALERKLSKDEAIEKMRSALDENNPADKASLEGLNEQQKAANKAFENETTTIKLLFGNLGEVVAKKIKGAVTLKGEFTKQKGRAFDSEGNPKITVGELNEVKAIVKGILDLKAKVEAGEGFMPAEVQKIAEDPLIIHFEKLIKKDGSLDGVFNKLEQQILKAGSEKRNQNVKEVEEEVAAAEEKARIEKEVGKDYIHKDELTAEQRQSIKENTESGVEVPHPQYPDYVRRPPPVEKPAKGTIVERLKEIESESISTTAKKIIEQSSVGDKTIDSENKDVFNYIARRKSKTGKSEAGSDVKEAISFSKWLYKEHNKGIKDATKADLQEYLDTGNKGKPFGYHSKGNRKKVNSQRRLNIMRWVKELKGIEGQGLRDVEALRPSPMERLSAREIAKRMKDSGIVESDRTPKEILSNIKSISNKIKELNKKLLHEVEVPHGKGTISIPESVVHFTNFVINIIGKRGRALRPDKALIFDDIGILPNKEMIITVTDKGGQSFVLRVPNEKILGVNYYETFKKAFIDNELPVKTRVMTDSNGKPLTDLQIDSLEIYVAGRTQKHQARADVYEVAALLDAKGAKNSTGGHSKGFWSTFADFSLVGHGQKGGDTAKEYYGKGYSKTNELQDIALFWKHAESLVKGKSKKQIFLGLDEGERIANIEGEIKHLKARISEIKLKQNKLVERNLFGSPGYDRLSEELNIKLDRVKELQGSKKQKFVPKNELTNNAPLAKEMLEKQVRELIKKYPGLKVMLSKKGEHAGEIENSLIKLVIGKADETSFFHETAHALEKVIRATKNKELINLWERGESLVGNWAEKHDPNRWKLFLREYGERAENEYLTQLTSEMALEKFKANTRIGKFGIWVKEFVSAFKNFFGFGSAKDISRQFGKMVEEGFDARVPIRVHKYQKTPLERKALTEKDPEYEAIKELQKKKGINSLDIMTALELWDLNDPTAGKNIYIDKYGNFSGLNRGQANAIIDFLSRNFPDKKPGKSSTWLALNGQAHALEIQNGITKKYAKIIKRMLGINFGTLSNASESQLKRYVEFIRNFGKEYPKETALIDEAFATEFAKKDSQFNKIFKAVNRMALPLGTVLRKMGATKVAEKLEDHYLTETRHVGEASVFISQASRAAGKKNLKYLPYALDPEMGKNNPHAPKGLDTFLKKASVPGREADAVKAMKDMYQYFWRSLILQGKQKIKNPRILEDWLATMEEKHVQNYFTRTLTADAREHLRIGSKGHEKAIKKLIQDITVIRTGDISKRIDKLTKQINEIPVKTKARKDYEKQLDEQRKLLQDISDNENNPKAETYKDIREQAEEQLLMLMRMQKNTVENKFLLSRLPRLDNFMINKKGKSIKVYEDKFDKVIGHYTRVMSKYLATVEHFNEYTNVRADYTFSSGTAGTILEKIGQQTEFGQYLERAVNRRLGMEKADLEGQLFTDGLQKVSKYSALYGLSSPFSGLKNLAIGTSLTIGVHGSRAFLHGFAKLFSADAWREAKRKGWTQIGTKELELSGWGAHWMKWWSWMTPTEAINRVVGGFAGEFNARQLVSSMRGEGYGLLKISPFKAKVQLAKLFNLSKKELIFLEDFGMDQSNIAFGGKSEDIIAKNMEAITDKIQHFGHIKSQGATGDPFLPLWAGNPNAKAATLFYRMAYSGTANIMNHVMQPALKGNVLPLARYVFAANLSGSALWAVYEKILGMKPPKINEDDAAQLSTNLAKAEALGLFSFVLNPYKVPGEHFGNLLLADSIMQPAIIRNSHVLGTNAWNILFSKKEINAKDTFKKGVKDIVVAFNHVGKYLSKKNTPFKTDINNTKSFKNIWLKSTGRWEEQQRASSNFSKDWTNEAPFYNLVRDAFLTNDLDSAARYYVATWYYLYDSKRVMNGYEQYNAKSAEQYTDSALKGTLDKINPLVFSDPNKSGNLTKEREAFLSYLNPENRAIAKKAEKTYYFRRRELDRKIASLWNKYGTMYNAGYIEKLFPIPPDNYLGSAKWQVSDKKVSKFKNP